MKLVMKKENEVSDEDKENEISDEDEENEDSDEDKKMKLVMKTRK